MVTLAGVIAIDVSALTVRLVLPTAVPLVAVIAVVPPATPLANPAAVMVATAGVPEVQVTVEVTTAVVASL
jgi:hypothetical protein